MSMLKYREPTETHPGFHLYEDGMDWMVTPEGEPDAPVCLRLDGVEVRLEALGNDGASVHVALPRELARELGILSSAQA